MSVRHELSRGGMRRASAIAAVALAFVISPPEPLSEADSFGVADSVVAPLPPPHEKTHKPLTPAEKAAKMVTAKEYREWYKVCVCEEGGNWHVSGSIYSGGLGISNHNWVAYGGRYFAPTAAMATPDEQIVIAERIQPNPPDQHGCTGSW